jgi:hypothetical protein
MNKVHDEKRGNFTIRENSCWVQIGLNLIKKVQGILFKIGHRREMFVLDVSTVVKKST